MSRLSKGLSTLAPNIWQQYADASEEMHQAPMDSKEACGKLRQWFRENAYLAADKLTQNAGQTAGASESMTNNTCDIRLTVLARAGDVVGNGPAESRDNIVTASEGSHPSTYFHLYTFAEPMPHRDANQSVSVVFRKDVINRGANPDVKDANFVRKRQVLLDCQGKSEETVMVESDNITSRNRSTNADISENTTNSLPDCWKSTIITEGICSNFFAVYRVPGKERSLIIRTAGNDRVLGGTVRELLLEKYSENSKDESEPFHLSISTTPPTVDEIQDWVGCFLTSTSRLVLPISEVILPVDSGSTQSIEKFIVAEDDRNWPQELNAKNENHKGAITAVVHRFDTCSQVMQTIVKHAKMQVLAHSTSMKPKP